MIIGDKFITEKGDLSANNMADLLIKSYQ